MKIFRFTGSLTGQRFAYIRATWFERKWLRERIAKGRNPNLYEFGGWEPGPKPYFARFALRAKPRLLR